MHRSLRERAFDAKTCIRRDVATVHRQLLRNERLDVPELQSLQNRLSRDIAVYASSASPFYRKLYEAHGTRASDLADPASWGAVPIIDRAAVKANASDFPTHDAHGSNVRPALTGGSTGEPLQTMHDARVPSLPLSWRMYSWWGIQPYDDTARIGRWSFGRRAQLMNDLSWWPTRQIYLDAGLISAESMQVFHDALVRVKPRLIEGYVGALLEFADFLEVRSLTIPRPHAVATTAAPLTGSARARLSDVFGAPVHDEYRGSEFGWIAGECAERDGLHIFADVCRVEVVDEHGDPVAPGGAGDLVLTDLRNRVFPLIRYRTGDRGSLRTAPCPCGRSLPLMDQPHGRTTDVLRLPSGAVLAHRLMGMFGAHPEAVRLFQIHQRVDYSITIRVVLGSGSRARAHVEEAVAALRDRIHHEVPVRIDYAESLPYTGGKVKYVISDVSS